MASGRQEVVTFKVDSDLLRRLDAVRNRSEFIRAAILHALENTCPLCGGRGVLTVRQRVHWEEFEHSHSLEKCDECHEIRLVCANQAGEPAHRGGSKR